MARFVIAGKADCPFYAKAELLADELSLNLPSFKVHKVVKRPDEWDEWLHEICHERGWKHSKSPLIWRELVDRGGKGILLGGCDDFLEMASCYYGINSLKLSEELVNISKENMITKTEVDNEADEKKKMINPLRICVSSASSSLAYGVLACLAEGQVFGPNQDVFITLLDEADTMKCLEGIAMEIQDCAWPLFRGAQATCDKAVAFKDVSVAILLDTAGDGKDPKLSTDKNESLLSSAKKFKEHGLAIEKYAKKDVKVLIAGGPVNVNTYITSKFAPSIPRRNFCALTRLEENRAKGLVARKLNVNTAGIKNLIIWGNISLNQFADLSCSKVDGYDGAIWGPHVSDFTRPVPEMVHDEKWLAGEFVESLKKRNENLWKERSQSASLSESAAILSQLCDWWQGNSDEMYSLGVISEGWYGIPEGIVFSFPVKFDAGLWKVVDDLTLSESLMANIMRAAQDLKAESEQVAMQLQ